MIFNESKISGCYEVIPNILTDKRGAFIKTFHKDMFVEKGLECDFVEEYYSISKQRVLRGMHYQKPPYHHTKLVYCVSGKVMDVVLDLRKESPSYGQYEKFDLNSETANIIYIPAGLAHGFYTISKEAILVYKTNAIFVQSHDSGVYWNSFEFNWQIENPILSERDMNLEHFDCIRTPF